MNAGIDSGSRLHRAVLGLGAALLLIAVPALPAAAQDFSARVWLDRGHEPVLRHGDRVRVYYRTSRDAYVAIFHLDTNGTVRLMHPRSPHDSHYVRAGRDYRMLFPRTSHWTVDEDPGVGYFFAVASPEPFDFGAFGYSARFAGSGWDLGPSMRRVYHDPYVAMDDFVASLIPDWEYVPYALDFATYNVGRSYDYPRFLCYDCHGFRTFSSWNPYLAACTSFRVVIYNDPYYYPAYRYRGARVVFVRPVVFRQPRFIFKERGRSEPADPIVRARPAVATQPPRTVPSRRSVDVREARPRQPDAQPASTRSARPRVQPGATPSTRTTPSRRALPSAARPSEAGPRVGSPSASRTRETPAGREAAPGVRSRVPARPTQALPGRTNAGGDAGAIGLRRRGATTTFPSTRRDQTGVGSTVPNRGATTRVLPPVRGATQPTAPGRSSAGQARIPTRSSPAVRSLPGNRVIRPGASSSASPPSSTPPPRSVPARTGPPPRSGPPAGTRPRVRTGPPPNGTGSSGAGSTGARPPVRVGGGGGG